MTQLKMNFSRSVMLVPLLLILTSMILTLVSSLPETAKENQLHNSGSPELRAHSDLVKKASIIDAANQRSKSLGNLQDKYDQAKRGGLMSKNERVEPEKLDFIEDIENVYKDLIKCKQNQYLTGSKLNRKEQVFDQLYVSELRDITFDKLKSNQDKKLGLRVKEDQDEITISVPGTSEKEKEKSLSFDEAVAVYDFTVGGGEVVNKLLKLLGAKTSYGEIKGKLGGPRMFDINAKNEDERWLASMKLSITQAELIKNACLKLPKYTSDKPVYLFQSMPENTEAFESYYKQPKFRTSKFILASKSEEAARSLAKPPEVRIKLYTKTAVDIHALSAAPEREEVLMNIGAVFSCNFEKAQSPLKYDLTCQEINSC